jgi:hypothetical protein
MSRFTEQNVFSFSTRPSETGVGNFLPTDATVHLSTARPPTLAHMLARHAHTRRNSTNTLSRPLQVSRGAGDATALAGQRVISQMHKTALMPKDTARCRGVGELARATRNQTHPAAKCMSRVHSSSAGRGRRVFAACRAWRQCKTDAWQVGHIVELRIIEKHLHTKKTNTRSRQTHTCDVLQRRSTRGTQNTRARDTLAASDLTRMTRPRQCNGRIRLKKTCITFSTSERRNFAAENTVILDTSLPPFARALERATQKHTYRKSRNEHNRRVRVSRALGESISPHDMLGRTASRGVR